MPAPLAPNGLYTGLLPSCNSVNGAAPCVESISKDPADDIIEAVKVPPGDPRMG
jgi:hypothetical protein